MAGLLVDTFGFDPALARITQLVLAFLVVVVAIVVGIWGFVRLTRRLRGDDEFGASRIRVADVVPVDDRRRLVLIRRDDIEHLVMIGGPTDIVVESGIRRVAPPRPAEARPAGRAEPPATPSPDPLAALDAHHEERRHEERRHEPALGPAGPHPSPAGPRRDPSAADLVRPPTRS